MRINKLVALKTGFSRRQVDSLINGGRLYVDGQPALLGQDVKPGQAVALDGKPIKTQNDQTITLLLNKPVGFIVSRKGQGSQTIYELIPKTFWHLKPVGRLDKDSSGLLLLTNNGQLAEQLTHPRFAKQKVYQVSLDKPLNDSDLKTIQNGVELNDGPSKLELYPLNGKNSFIVRMREGRNRQVRRTFAALGYTVTRLHRTGFGDYQLGDLPSGATKQLLTPGTGQHGTGVAAGFP